MAPINSISEMDGCHGLVLLEIIFGLIDPRYHIDKAMKSICGIDAKKL